MGAIIVTGIPGVGKTTVMELAAKGANLPIVVYGTVMFDVAKARGLASHRDDMRRLPASVQKDIQKAAAEKIASMGDVIVDTHCSIRTPAGYLPGLPAWVLEALKPSMFVLVEADPEEIHGRRERDATRQRDVESVASIAEHQATNRSFAAAYATLSGGTILAVQNRDGHPEEAVAKILLASGQVAVRRA
ncbi:MAG: adenylate kinase [Thermoplasmatota archaeon]